MPILGSTAFKQARDAMELVRSLLADLDVTGRSYITASPTGAVRVSGISTITTTSAHGLVPGDVVFIQAVVQTSFNGTYQVDTVPTSTTFTYLQVSEGDNISGQGYLDQLNQGDVYTDTILFPMLNASYRDVQRALLEDGSPTATDDVEWLDVATNTTVISDVTDPQLPADFLAPRMLYERMQGQRYRALQPVDELPDRSQQALNYVFSWRTEAIYLPGATNRLDLKLRYYRTLADLTDADSYILIRGGSDAVAYDCAFKAATSRSDPRAITFKVDAERELGKLLDMQAHSGQYMPRRRQPYGGRQYLGRGYVRWGW